MIIGTAGHIDHGKTSLVRALTGVDTDRLQEEKARGISIELGYAYVQVPAVDGRAATVLGFIDMPGHEKFVHTMAAGAVGIDHALLVVAADDGVMPQTREHLAILELLGVQQATVVLTKTDRATDQRLAQVRQQVQELLAPTALAGASLFTTAATQANDPGTTQLRAHLMATARQAEARPRHGLFRLAIDRVFTLPGQGTIVTGTVFAGQVQVGDSLRHSASGQLLRVRSIHAQNQPSHSASAGQRCALNLAGVERTSLCRGDWMLDPAGPQASRRIDLRLQLLPEAPTLQPWASVHVHLGTAHQVAHVVPLEGDSLATGQQALVQLVFEQDVFATAGERLIVRNAQASRTIGGALVLDPYAPARKRKSSERMATLAAIEQLLAAPTGQAPNPSALLQQAPHGLLRSQLVRLLGLPAEQLALAEPLLQLPAAHNDALLLFPERLQQLQQKLLQTLAQAHEQHPDEPGLNAARLRRIALPGLTSSSHDALWQGLLVQLLATQALQQTGPWLHLPSHQVTLSAAEQLLAPRLLAALAAGGNDPPWVRDLALAHQSSDEQVRQLLRKLARQGHLFQVVKDLFYSSAAIASLAALLARLAEDAPRQAVEARQFRDACGLGRKRAIQVLEFFNRVGYTRRSGDVHLLRPDAPWRHSAIGAP